MTPGRTPYSVKLTHAWREPIHPSGSPGIGGLAAMLTVIEFAWPLNLVGDEQASKIAMLTHGSPAPVRLSVADVDGGAQVLQILPGRGTGGGPCSAPRITRSYGGRRATEEPRGRALNSTSNCLLGIHLNTTLRLVGLSPCPHRHEGNSFTTNDSQNCRYSEKLLTQALAG